MRPTIASKAKSEERRAWEPPAVTQTPIAVATQSPPNNPQSAAPSQPQPPGAPATKLGFSFEMAFPLSARTQ